MQLAFGFGTIDAERIEFRDLMQETFLRLSEGRPLLLPRLQPLGDIDADELLLAGGDEAAGLGEAEDFDLPPAIAPLPNSSGCLEKRFSTA